MDYTNTRLFHDYGLRFDEVRSIAEVLKEELSVDTSLIVNQHNWYDTEFMNDIAICATIYIHREPKNIFYKLWYKLFGKNIIEINFSGESIKIQDSLKNKDNIEYADPRFPGEIYKFIEKL